jgi:hypothetical protein
MSGGEHHLTAKGAEGGNAKDAWLVNDDVKSVYLP